MSSKFNVGDRIVLVSDNSEAKKGMKGTIKFDDGTVSSQYAVEFDESFRGGHDCNGHCEDGKGHWIIENRMQLIPKFEVGQVYKVGKLTYQHQWENAIVKITDYGSSFVKIKALRGDCPKDFMKDSEYARALTLLTGKEIGEAIRKWDEDHAPKPKYREVKRHAKKGEYIKAICDSQFTERYKKGDILLVTTDDGAEMADPWKGKAVGYDHTMCVIEHDEYVVLEGYKPKQKEERRKAKVGDTIKIVHGEYDSAAARIGAVGKVVSVNEKEADAKFPPYTHDYNLPYSIPHDNYEIVSSGKHSYTAEQIAKAKKLCGEMMVEAFDEAGTQVVRFADRANGITLYADNITCEIGSCSSNHSGEAKCSDHDEYNVWIGRCVALCKALHKQIPTFITED